MERFVVTFLCAAHILATTAYSHCKILDCASGFRLSWQFANASVIDVSMLAPSAGAWSYAAIGLSAVPSTGRNVMISPGTGTDIIVGWVNGSGHPFVRDYWVSTYAIPSLDTVQDVVIRGGGAQAANGPSGSTILIEWSRPLVPASASQDRPITPGTAQTVLWAFNPNAGAVTAADGSTFQKHLTSTRGAVDLDFGLPSSCDPSLCQARHSHGGAVDAPAFAGLTAQCFGNGWPSAEAGGDRDGGDATPSAAAIEVARAAALGARPCLASPDNVVSVIWSAHDPTLPNGTHRAAGAKAALYFTMRTSAKGWMGLGFNSQPTMSGADMVVGWVTPRGGATQCAGVAACDVYLVDSFAEGNVQPRRDTDGGGSQDVAILDARVDASGSTIVFRRFHSTGDASGKDADLSTGNKHYILWAYGTAVGNVATGAFPAHSLYSSGYGLLAVDLAASADVCGAASLSLVSSRAVLKSGGAFAVHGCFMVLAFWFCMTVGAAAARYRDALGLHPASPLLPAAHEDADEELLAPSTTCWSRVYAWKKKDPWFILHVVCQILVILLALLGLLSVRAALGWARTGAAVWKVHQTIGAATLVLTGLQFGLGLARPVVTSPRRSVWLLAHRLLALACLILSHLAIPTGLQRAGAWGSAGIIITIAQGICVCVFLAVTEVAWPTCKAVRSCLLSGRPSTSPAAVMTKTTPQERDTATFDGFNTMGSMQRKNAEGGLSKPANTQRSCCSYSSLCAVVAVPALFSAVQCTWILINAGSKGTLSPGSFFTGAAPAVEYPGGDVSLCMRFHNFTVPPRDTSYMCRGFSFPPNVPLHALSFIPVVDRGDLVHHMILYASKGDYSKSGVSDCASMPPVTGPLWVWAVGGDAFKVPDSVGVRVGADTFGISGDISTGQAYAVLQIHYSNPSRTVGVKDGSGVLMRVTDVLRPIDAGLVQLGVKTGMIKIAPGRTFGISGTCPASTTRALKSANTVNPLTDSYTVYGTALHMHTLGRRIWVEQWRDGKRIKDANGGDALGEDQMYDFGNQRFLPPVGTATLNPGDKLVTQCVWENTVAAGKAGGNRVAEKGSPVTGGESTENEMCLAFLAIYPRVGAGAGVGCEGSPLPLCDSTRQGGLPSCDTVV